MTPKEKIKELLRSKASSEQEYEENCGDIEDEVRCGEYETDILPIYNRNYESKSVAGKMLDGTWVGWTYFYGGGKHGQPEAVNWMDEAYQLECTEEQQVVTVRKWRKVE